ncbi:glycerol-3-phosphate 1-O-acyltransferase PlsY [Phaeovibrio sulfidiphilus]|uniref:glycerol-3-phosphate 1-O-acyltransferase PlsY n=1 Tax=Phaeovibrio sulfidiphilus TaxID=1220600 RepID=UPI003B8377D2
MTDLGLALSAFVSGWPALLGLAVFGYLLGSVPFGLVLVRLAGLGDIRQIGSGNVGATNVLRTGRKGLAALTLLLDSGKGALAAAIAWVAFASVDAALIAGVFAVLGHNFPVWLKFNGGKGVATTLGVILVTSWPVGLLCLATWLAVAAIFRYSSLAALVALAAAPVLALFFASFGHALAFLGLAVLAWIRHRSNIERLRNGTETKIGQKKTA